MNELQHQFELVVEIEDLGVSDHSDDDYDTDSDTDSEWWSEPEDDDADTVSEPEEVEVLPPPWFRARPLNPNDIPAMHELHGGFAREVVVPLEEPRRAQDETDSEDEEEEW